MSAGGPTAEPWLLVCAWAERAIANAWSCGASPERARELRRLLTRLHGAEHGFPGQVDARVERLAQRWRARAVEVDAAPAACAMASLERELGLSEVAADVLLALAAIDVPQWGELAQLYRLLAELVAVEPTQVPCEYLLHELLDGTWSRDEISAELEEDAPLVASGLVAVAGRRPFAVLTASPAVTGRLRGRAPTSGLPVERVLPSRARRLDEVPAELASLGPSALRVAVRGACHPQRASLRGLASRWRRPIAVLDAADLAALSPASALACLRQLQHGGDIPAIDETTSAVAAQVPAGYQGPLVYLVPGHAPPRVGAFELVADEDGAATGGPLLA